VTTKNETFSGLDKGNARQV